MPATASRLSDVTSGPAQEILYEPDDPSPLGVTLVGALQGIAIVLTAMVLVVEIYSQVRGAEEVSLWPVFASLVIAGAMTALQAARFGRIGTGHVVIMGPTLTFASVVALAAAAGGPGLMAALIVASAVVHVVLAVWLPKVRRIITPTVSGTMLMLISVTLLPFVVEPLLTVPEGAPRFSGAVMAFVTLAGTVMLAWRGRGAWRLWSPLLVITAGAVVAIPFGAYEFGPVLDAAWIGVPSPELPSLDEISGVEFWSLLPAFVLVTVVSGIRVIGDTIAVQQAARREPRAADMRLAQGSLAVDGLGYVLAGMAGGPPTSTYGAESVSLTTFTGVAARRVGFAFGAILILLACSPKLITLFVTLPEPVVGTYILVVISMMFITGVKMIANDGLDASKALLVGISFSLGVALDARSAGTELLGSGWGLLLDNGIIAGALCAVAMSAGMRLSGAAKRRSRLDVPLAMSSLPAIDEFVERLADKHGWNRNTRRSLSAASEETVIVLLDSSEPSFLEDEPSLIVRAQSDGDLVEMEFVAILDADNIEDRLASLSDEAISPAEANLGDLPLRLLRHYAESAQHQKFYGLDIVTVRIRAEALADT